MTAKTTNNHNSQLYNGIHAKKKTDGFGSYTLTKIHHTLQKSFVNIKNNFEPHYNNAKFMLNLTQTCVPATHACYI